jgi:hypothetical protein
MQIIILFKSILLSISILYIIIGHFQFIHIKNCLITYIIENNFQLKIQT